MAKPLVIDCEEHGRSAVAAVCGHLVQNFGAPLGFVENSDDPADKQGWCYACELVYNEEQDKTPRFRAFCRHAVVCSQCYDDIKARHDFDAGAGHAGD
jgi:hypothetical protein